MASRIPSLDGLRGLAAYIVVVSHVSNATGLWGKNFGNGAGQIGVMIFFVLSGFLMGHLYIGREWNMLAVKRFCVSRVARVFPLYLALVTFSFIWFQYKPLGESSRLLHVYGIDTTNVLNHLFFIEGYSVFWTIPVEVHFYLLFVFFWYMFFKVRHLFYAVSIIVILAVLINRLPTFGMKYLITGYIHYFIIGIGVSQLNKIIPVSLNRNENRVLDIGFIILLCSAPLLFPVITTKLFNYRFNVWLSPVHMIYCASLLYFTARSKLAQKVLGWRPLAFMGLISYSLYLTHTPIQHTIARNTQLDDQPLLFLLAVSIVSILVSIGTYYLIEKPSGSFISSKFMPAKPAKVEGG